MIEGWDEPAPAIKALVGRPPAALAASDVRAGDMILLPSVDLVKNGAPAFFYVNETSRVERVPGDGVHFARLLCSSYGCESANSPVYFRPSEILLVLQKSSSESKISDMAADEPIAGAPQHQDQEPAVCVP